MKRNFKQNKMKNFLSISFDNIENFTQNYEEDLKANVIL